MSVAGLNHRHDVVNSRITEISFKRCVPSSFVLHTASAEAGYVAPDPALIPYGSVARESLARGSHVGVVPPWNGRCGNRC